MSATVTVTENVVVKIQNFPVNVYDSLTVTEDITPRIRNFPVNVYDTATVTESIVPKLICNIKPVTITGNQLWSKLNSASDVTSPTNGTGGAEVGSPTYVASKFGNGILSDANGEYCTFPTAANSINLDKGTIEFWAKMNFDELDASHHYLLDFFGISHGGLRLFFSAGDDDFRVYVWQLGGLEVDIFTVGMAWNVGDLLHFGLTWDREGNDIGSSKTVALYIDNVEKASSTTTWDTDTVNENLYIGQEKSGVLHSDAVIDNLKTYDVCKTDFSHKETEGLTSGPAESVTVSESVSMTGASNVSVSDNVTVTDVDAVQLLTLFNLAVNDSLVVSESLATPKLSYRPSVYDLVTLTELVSGVASLADISVSDNVTVTESIVPNLVNLISTSDSATISEFVSGVASLADISVYDTVTILEKLYFEWWQGVDEPTAAWTDVDPTDIEPDGTAWTDVEPDEAAWTDV